jgi:hypothetical protein
LRTLVPDPGAARLAWVKVAETALGNPVTEKATGALKPPLTVTVRVMLLFDPSLTVRELAEAAA